MNMSPPLPVAHIQTHIGLSRPGDVVSVQMDDCHEMLVVMSALKLKYMRTGF